MGLKIVIVRLLFIAAICALVIAIGVMGSARADDRTKMRDALNIEPGIGYGLMTGMNETASKLGLSCGTTLRAARRLGESNVWPG
jgi:hypothetical protein